METAQESAEESADAATDAATEIEMDSCRGGRRKCHHVDSEKAMVALAVSSLET